MTIPIVFGSTGRGSRACGSNRPSSESLRRSAASCSEQVALAGEAQLGAAERERGRGGRAAGVVVGAAADDDLGAVADRPLGQLQPVPGVAPHRAGQRAVGVAQLEVDALGGDPQAGDLADQQDARARLRM